RNNPLSQSKLRGVAGHITGGITPIGGPGIFTLYSAGEGQGALDSLGANDVSPNSVFTRVLVSVLAKPGLTLDEMARLVRHDVQRLADTIGFKQIPAYYDQTTGPIYLAGRQPKSP